VRDIAAGVRLDGGPLDGAALRGLGSFGERGADVWVQGPVGLAGSPVVDAEVGLALVWEGRLDSRAELLVQTKQTAGKTLCSDRDIVLAAYRECGLGVLDFLAGDFALVIWDARRRTLVAARDHFGVRPLHYTVVGSTCWVTSRIAQLRRLTQVGRGIDEGTLASFLAGALASPERTFFDRIFRIPPGHVLAVADGSMRTRRYWDPRRNPDIVVQDDGDYGDIFYSLLSRAVSDRLRCARRVGLLLSGGVDSAAVACTVADLQGTSPRPNGLATFTATFDTPGSRDRRSRTEPLNELYGFEGHHLPGDLGWTFQDLPGEAGDEPVEGMYVRTVRALLEAARTSGVDVVLSGYGGDVVLGGNPYYLLDLAIARRWTALLDELRSYPPWRRWQLLLRYVAKPLMLRRPGATTRPCLPDWVSPQLKSQAARAEPIFQPEAGGIRGLSQRAELAAQVLPQQAARMLWYHSEALVQRLELRHPFFDRRLFEFLLAVPMTQKIDKGRPKALLRQMLAGRLPSAGVCSIDDESEPTASRAVVLERERREWDAAFVDARSAELGYVDLSALMAAFARYQKGDSVITYALARTYRVELWLKRLLGDVGATV
jgi:asparagine synthase (glutamine-hydrolysing)